MSDNTTQSGKTSASQQKTLSRPDGTAIAYHKTDGAAPGVIFLGGFRSDMTGTKAAALEAFCRENGRAFVRFDYFGHGGSDGEFTDGTIGRWAEDAIAVLDEVTDGHQVLVGSSMGGWLMLLTALARPGRVAGLIGIAAAPDFTERLMWDHFPPEAKKALEADGIYFEPSDYDDGPYPITMKLIEEGRKHLLLDTHIAIHCPVRLIHGMKDKDVPWGHVMLMRDQILSDHVTMTLIKDGDHRLSREEDIRLICHITQAMCEEVG